MFQPIQLLRPIQLLLKHGSRSHNIICSLRTLTSGNSLQDSSLSTTAVSKDDYFAAIHHISNIVRREVHPERTLNRMNLSVNSELVFRVLRSCSNSPTESLCFFSWARSHYTPTSVEFEELIKTLIRHRKYESMWKTIQQMQKQQLTLSCDTLSFIIEEYGRNGLADQAVEVFNRSTNLGCKQTVSVYNSLLFALCEVKMFHGAYALIRRMIRKGEVPDKRTYAILVNGWCSAGKMKEAQDFLEDMSKKGFNPPVRGRDLLIEGLLNAGYLESAKKMVRRMTKEGFVPDVATFNSLTETICKTEEVDFCIDMYHSVCKLGFCPDINTYKILIPAASKVGRIDEAFILLNNSIEQGYRPFPSLYAPIIKGLCRKGQFDDAFSFFSEMKIKGHSPNRPVYTMLITMCGRGGRFVEAANYLVEMTELGLAPISRCFDMVTDGLKNCGKHDLAKRIEQLEVSLRRA
ncbi:Pentatricopeptide repeat-containing protein [Hibiscus syriacus]|uniref:Pentatricopeptide repeat-containing protein n=1 Tax=Hibiscus syriacus TaxID=106335 RepID=A0A6A2YHA9_HIBSY|nr:pentatricopeptide repeat-containing protein At5g18390, mitochondrial-like [Hibiscus syriacus]KAE8677019.1 Pentatricopeptide repeat-containing protein [Hibiscus syriacus]